MPAGSLLTSQPDKVSLWLGSDLHTLVVITDKFPSYLSDWAQIFAVIPPLGTNPGMAYLAQPPAGAPPAHLTLASASTELGEWKTHLQNLQAWLQTTEEKLAQAKIKEGEAVAARQEAERERAITHRDMAKARIEIRRLDTKETREWERLQQEMQQEEAAAATTETAAADDPAEFSADDAQEPQVPEVTSATRSSSSNRPISPNRPVAARPSKAPRYR